MVSILMTVDTEGDNLWDWQEGKTIEIYNSNFIQPFQNLCEKYKIVPVYLVNYEMTDSDQFMNFLAQKSEAGLCEIGMHLHAWNSPPEIKLDRKYSGNPYIIEYTRQQIFEKHKFLMDIIIKKTGVKPITYRSGRWATNEDLFDVLSELGFCVDCSVTPGIYHKSPGATVRHANNYRKASKEPYRLKGSLWEIPMTTDIKRTIKGNTLYRKAINILRGEEIWLRPALQTSNEMKLLVEHTLKKEAKYLMFMIHSSELMPGGSPYCKTENDVDAYLEKLESIFKVVTLIGNGCSIKEYYENELRGK